MRMLAKIMVDTEAGNEAIKNGTFPKILGKTMDTIKPEAAYFTAEDGKRTAYFFFDLKDVSDIPVIAEPWFTELHAAVSFRPVMIADDVAKGLQKAAG